ncbi:MAG: restriction endonuclease [Candidatus Sifarchaeia archaeon]
MSRKSTFEDILEVSYKKPVFGLIIGLVSAVLGLLLSNVQVSGGSNLGRSFAFSMMQFIGKICYLISTISLIVAGIGFVIISIKKRKQETFFASKTTLNDLKKLSWKEFENYVGSLFDKLGYSVEVTGGLKDGGIDLIIKKDNKTSLVQCKNYRVSKVNVSKVRDFYGAMNASLNYETGYFITTGIFTLDAKQFAEDKPIELIDGARLMDYVNKASMEEVPQRNTSQPVKPSDVPICPKCGSIMVMRTAKKGRRAGAQFWGCSTYPKCNAIINIKS